jgi:hypothetical protein
LVRRPLLGLLYQPRMIDECEIFGGMRIVRENRSIRRKPGPLPLCLPQIPHDLTWGDGKPATNCLSYGTTALKCKVETFYTQLASIEGPSPLSVDQRSRVQLRMNLSSLNPLKIDRLIAKSLMALISTAILGSESHGTHNHILLFKRLNFF